MDRRAREPGEDPVHAAMRGGEHVDVDLRQAQDDLLLIEDFHLEEQLFSGKCRNHELQPGRGLP